MRQWEKRVIRDGESIMREERDRRERETVKGEKRGR